MILLPPERIVAVETLLAQYRSYQIAATVADRQRISDEMRFADPIVWILYKYHAYQGTHHALSTWGELIAHSRGHDGICGKRLRWLERKVASYGVEIMKEESIPLRSSLLEVAALPMIEQIASDNECMTEWRQYEYEEYDGNVAKWHSFQ
jgi:hypothetical protein